MCEEIVRPHDPELEPTHLSGPDWSTGIADAKSQGKGHLEPCAVWMYGIIRVSIIARKILSVHRPLTMP